MFNVLQNYDIRPEDRDDPVLYHRIAETFKWAYAARTKMGDPADPTITDFMTEVWLKRG